MEVEQKKFREDMVQQLEAADLSIEQLRNFVGDLQTKLSDSFTRLEEKDNAMQRREKQHLQDMIEKQKQV